MEQELVRGEAVNGEESLYLRSKGTIIAGDAAVLENGRLAIANPQFTLDMDKAAAALDSLLKYDANTIICYHGGIFTRERHGTEACRVDLQGKS